MSSRRAVAVLLAIGAIVLIAYPWIEREQQRRQQAQILGAWEQAQAELQATQAAAVRTGLDRTRPAPEPADSTIVAEPGDRFELPSHVKGIEVKGVLRIDKIDLKEPLLEGTSKMALKLGIGTVVSGRKPGEIGNYALAGHRSWTYDHQFNRLDELDIGDEIVVQTAADTFTYAIHAISIVTPDEVSVLDEQNGKAEITLITCEPLYKATHRLIVKGELKST
ncbi:class D sortase [Paenibacillus sp. IB182496]|uniref:Class D sortase n=1 Tax=Paenibacillus sabuli TaxID=2772509 RepID=A0A927GPU1_9BACL|nr:class D sortase [Paenibacillus sabuli]MBD2843678.1 class D sortase [Paenibacillus sabuli]